jgi:PEP-CTERM motif-containing protein
VGGGLVIGGTGSDSSTVTIAASDANGNSLSAPAALTLTGTGQITGLGSPQTNLTWRPDQLFVSPVFQPTIITWTASAPGSYTITSTILPNQSSSNPGLGTISSLNGGGGNDSDSGQFTQMVNFNSGDSVSFLAGQGGTSGGPLEISFGSADNPAVPEPSSLVALFGLVGTSLLGSTWISRGRFRWPKSSRSGE